MRLVEHQHILVAMDHHRLQRLLVARIDRLGRGAHPVWRRAIGQRRDADLLAREKAGIGLCPLAVHADLAGAKHLLERALGERGEMAAEPAVEARIALVGRHLTGLNGHDAGR